MVRRLPLTPAELAPERIGPWQAAPTVLEHTVCFISLVHTPSELTVRETLPTPPTLECRPRKPLLITLKPALKVTRARPLPNALWWQGMPWETMDRDPRPLNRLLPHKRRHKRPPLVASLSPFLLV